MTVAICIQCGAKKFGAWTPCPACGFEPTAPGDRAKALMVTDHYMSEQDLSAIGERIGKGEQIVFSESDVTDIQGALTDDRRLPIGCTIAMWTPVAIMLLLLVLVVLTLTGVVVF